jgi:hypothetical protein
LQDRRLDSERTLDGIPGLYLALEERATCPRDCARWRCCYTNKMPHADRFRTGPDLEWRLEREVALLAARHPHGFAVHLHDGGDFDSVGYVDFWGRMLARHPAMVIWAYTARHSPDPIAAALVALKKKWPWLRLAMRFSGVPESSSGPSTMVVEHLGQVPRDGTITCPVELGLTESCSTCALRWQSRRPIAFARH